MWMVKRKKGGGGRLEVFVRAVTNLGWLGGGPFQMLLPGHWHTAEKLKSETVEFCGKGGGIERKEAGDGTATRVKRSG